MPWMREVAQLPPPAIATRTELIALTPRLVGCVVCLCWLAGVGWWGRPRGRDGGWSACIGAGGRLDRRCGGLLTVALGVDQLGEPAHLGLDRLHAVGLQLGRVAVHLLLGARELVLHSVEPLLQPAAPALEDPEPRLDVGAAEEEEPDVEVVVLPRGGSDVGHQAGEAGVTGGGELVDDPLPAAH